MPDRSPNVVPITADPWRGDYLGCEVSGRESAHVCPVMTPHLTQRTAEGVRFSQASADFPLCMPQRVTMLTGTTVSPGLCRGTRGEVVPK